MRDWNMSKVIIANARGHDTWLIDMTQAALLTYPLVQNWSSMLRNILNIWLKDYLPYHSSTLYLSNVKDCLQYLKIEFWL